MSLTSGRGDDIVLLSNITRRLCVLTLPKRPPITLALASGVLVFTVGLAGSAAYFGTNVERMPYSFNTQQQIPKTTTETEAEPATAEVRVEDEAQSRAEPVVVPAPAANVVAPVSPAPAAPVPVVAPAPAAATPVDTPAAPVVQPAPTQDESGPITGPISDLVDGLGQLIGL